MSENLKIDLISIQSFVLYGFVGNNAVIPVLHKAGITVSAVPTVFYSNSPLYPTLYGDKIPDEWFKGYLQALEDREILKSAQYILLGYLGNPAQAELLREFLIKVRKNYPQIKIQIDPVLGDVDCGLYVDERLAENYKNGLAELGDILTPNHFELEFLTGEKLESETQCLRAAQSLLGQNTQIIVATSVAPKTWQEGETKILVCTKNEARFLTHPYFENKAQGTGDAFSANLATNLLKNPQMDIFKAVENSFKEVMKIVQNSKNLGELNLIRTIFKD